MPNFRLLSSTVVVNNKKVLSARKPRAHCVTADSLGCLTKSDTSEIDLLTKSFDKGNVM